MIELTLPYPISANRYWLSFYAPKIKRVITGPTKEATAYKRQVARIAEEAGIRAPLEGRVRVELDLYPQRPQDWAKRAKADPLTWDDTVRCIDLDNARKVIYDALKMVVFADDKMVYEDTGRRMAPDGEARVVVRVIPITPALPLFPGDTMIDLSKCVGVRYAALAEKPF